HKRHKTHKRQCTLLCVLCFLWFLPLSQSQSPQRIPLKRFDVIRIEEDGIGHLPPALRNVFEGPVQSPERPVDTVEDAARRIGFTPRLPPGKPMELFVTSAVRDETKIVVTDLVNTLREAKISDAAVPQSWNGLSVRVEQAPGLIADYGEFFIAQSPPM